MNHNISRIFIDLVQISCSLQQIPDTIPLPKIQEVRCTLINYLATSSVPGSSPAGAAHSAGHARSDRDTGRLQGQGARRERETTGD